MIGRKARRENKTVTSSAVGGVSSDGANDNNKLALLHLRKIFYEFSRAQISSPEYERKLFKIIPLFYKIIENYDSDSLHSDFKEIYQFTDHVSRLFVQEVKRRASNQNTETAAAAIAEFLEPEMHGETSENVGNGWILLKTLSFLVHINKQNIIEAMCAAGLPNTLAKSLYLFYDLPLVVVSAVDQGSAESLTLSVDERRQMMNFTFVELFVRLCSHSQAAEELARRDDMALLFMGLGSWCPKHNLAWRKATANVLTAIISHALTPMIVDYIKAKKFLRGLLDSLDTSEDVTLMEKVEIVESLIALLKNSCDTTPALLEEFRSIKGYHFFVEFILKRQHLTELEDRQALCALVHVLATAVYIGPHDLKPFNCSDAMFHLPGFNLPTPLGKGVTVRNVQAFHLLQLVFVKCSNFALCSVILDVVSGIFSVDSVNYFLVDKEYPFGKFAEAIHGKNREVQAKFFEILEFTVFHLNHVPIREFIALGVMLRMPSSIECRALCLQSLRKILGYSGIFKDVFREASLLEVFANLMEEYACALQADTAVSSEMDTLLLLIMDVVALMIKSNSTNGNRFRQVKGLIATNQLINYEQSRISALQIVQQNLMLTQAGEDDISTLLAMVHSADKTDLKLKYQILKTLLHTLKESHKVRVTFRKVSGFVYVMTILITYEGALASPPLAPWDNIDLAELMELLKLVFKVLTVAMRFEPSNARMFISEVGFTSLAEALQLLGCFESTLTEDAQLQALNVPENNLTALSKHYCDTFGFAFVENPEFDCDSAEKSLVHCCFMFYLLYALALDNFERPKSSPSRHPSGQQLSSSSVAPSPNLSEKHNPSSTNGSLLGAVPVEGLIVYPGAVICMLKLLPFVHCENTVALLSFQIYITEIIKSLVRRERNQQVMCEAGLPQVIFDTCGPILTRDGHPLQSPIYYILERLAAQSMRPKELRQFLRLDSPLCCRDLDDETASTEGEGESLPLSRVKTLVSMMTPRDFRVLGVFTNPPFIEFDMSVEGFGCIYLPSIAPQGANGASSTGVGSFYGGRASMVVPSSVNPTAGDPSAPLSGLGSGERVFPPLTGLTFVSWIYIERYSDPRVDSHPIRLLTIVRSLLGASQVIANQSSRSPAVEEATQLGCLSVQISPIDRALIISTNETDTPGADLDRDMSGADTFIRVPIEDLRQEQQWIHLAVVFNRAVLKNSSVTVFINGSQFTNAKLRYLVQNPGGGAATLNNASFVNAFIGTPPGPFRRQSRLLWRLGTTYLLEEAWSLQQIRSSFRLGPHYTGCFQRPILPTGERIPCMMAEDKVGWGLSATAVSQMTLKRLRTIYNKVDSKVIAKQMGISSHENATPIWLLHNLAGHLGGPARSFGGVLLGYLGVRTFRPQPVSRLLESVGGVQALLGLVAMVTNAEGLYASVKALLCALRSNRAIEVEMNRIRGFQILGVLLKEKSTLLNSHMMHLIFSLVGTLDSTRSNTTIPNLQAFEDMLGDLEIWKNAAPELHRLIFEHIYELISEHGEPRRNLQTIRNMSLICRLLFILDRDRHVLVVSKDVIFNLFAAILQPPCDTSTLLKFGQFIASTLPASVESDSELTLPADPKALAEIALRDESTVTVARRVYVRNRCLAILVTYLQNVSGNLNYQLAEQIVNTLGFDWVTHCMGSKVHVTTVQKALRLLLGLLHHPALLQKFQEGTNTGGWLNGAESVVQNTAGILLGFSVSAHGGSVGSSVDMNPEICHIPGFMALQFLLPCHAQLAGVYLAMLSILVGHPAKNLPENVEFTMDTVWTHVFNIPSNHSVSDAMAKVELSPDAVLVLLAIARRSLHTIYPATVAADVENNHVDKRKTSVSKSPQHFPVELFNFLTFLYHNVDDFTQFCMTDEFLSALYATLFPDSLSELSDTTDVDITTCPAYKQVMDLLRNILVDSFSLNPNGLNASTGKGESVVDILLELYPSGASETQVNNLFTALLHATAQHLVAADALLYGISSSLPQTHSLGNNYNTVAANVFYFASRLVDCLWSNVYTSTAAEVFDFVVKLLGQARRKGSGLPLDTLYRSLNRCVLYLLSRGADSKQILDSLNRLTTNRQLLFGSANNDQEFFACLIHLLFISTLPENRETIGQNEMSEEMKEASVFMSSAAKRVWEEVYLNKKQLLEENFHLSLVSEIVPSRNMAGDVVLKVWQSYLDMELRGHSANVSAKDIIQIHAQLQSKIQKVAGGIQRLASRRTIQSMRPSFTSRSASTQSTITSQMSSVTPQALELWMGVHVSLIRELFLLQRNQNEQWHEHVQKYCLSEWRQIERELTRERGLWGPENGSVLDRWTLDNTEGPCRVRKKLIPNDLFYVEYPFRPNLELIENKNQKYKVATSRDSKRYYERMKQRRPLVANQLRIIDTSKTVRTPSEENPLILPLRDLTDINQAVLIRKASVKQRGLSVDSEKLADEKAEVEEIQNSPETEPQSLTGFLDAAMSARTAGEDPSMEGSVKLRKPLQSFSSMSSTPPQNTPVTKPIASTSKMPDNQTLLRLLEEGDELQSMFRCARINGLEVSEGLLLFCKQHYYVVDGYTLLKTKEIRDLEFLPEDMHDPIVPYTAVGNQRPKAASRQCNKFSYEDIREVLPRRYLLQPIALEVFSADGRNYLLSFPRKTRNKVYSKFLNVAKGLSESEQSVSGQKTTTQIESGGNLLSSLIGETSVTQRWARGEISNFQYLMHLNTLAGRSYNDLMQYPVFPWIVADYESEELDLSNPATFRDLSKPMGAQTESRLQQFLKRYREWDDPSGETLPYMYGTHYSSAMIVVSYLVRIEPFTQQFLSLQGGHFDLADRMFHSIEGGWLSASQNNMADVKELIPEFFCLPDFLVNSNNFDFGTKQNGIQLHDAVLPVWAKGDPKEFVRVHREALECDYVSAHLHEWIDLIFGYKQQGPASIDANNLFHHLFYEGNVDFDEIEDPLVRNATIGFVNNFGQIPSQLFKKPHPVKKLKNPTECVQFLPGVTYERLFYHFLDGLKAPFQPYKQLKGIVGQIVQTEKNIVCCVEQNKVLIPPAYIKYIAWGFADNSIRIGSVESDRSSCVYEASDCGEIVCAVCPNNRTLITGGTNTVINVWEIIASGRGGAFFLRLRKDLYGHTESISALASSGSFGIVVSGSQDCTCIVWDLSKLTFIRQLFTHPFAISAITINDSTGDIATASGSFLYVWDIGGHMMASINTIASPKLDSKILIMSIAFSYLNDWDQHNVIVTGSSDGITRFWGLEYTPLMEQMNDRSDEADDVFAVQPSPAIQNDSEQSAGSTIPNSSSAAKRQKQRDYLHSLKNINADTLRLKLMEKQQRYESGQGNSSAVTPDLMSPGMYTQSEATSGSLTPACPSRSLSTSRDDEVEVTQQGVNSHVSHVSRNMSQSSARQEDNDSGVCVNRDRLELARRQNAAGLRTEKPNCLNWQKHLVFRSKLTMHTAVDRKDNPTPAAITAITPSRDHKTLYIGDSRGRVWGWVCGDIGTSRADHWVQDLSRSTCTNCQQKFTFSERRHHCRNCGQIFCAKCSRFESEIKQIKSSKPVRVCQPCYQKLRLSGGGSDSVSTTSS